MAEQLGDKAKGELALHQLPGQLFFEDDINAEFWYDASPPWPETSTSGLRGTKAQWFDVASDALSSTSRMFEKRMVGTSKEATQKALSKEKTIADKIAAYTLAVQESPLHRLDELQELLSCAQKKGRHERLQAMDALKDLFINDLLPNDRRLIFFHDRNLKCEQNSLSKRHLAYALFESELKTVYREFIQTLEESGKDSVLSVRTKVVKLLFELLVAKPENERTLLSMLVNKLGDPEKKVSSVASSHLALVLEKHHPQMRKVVVQEVEHLLKRPNITRKAQFYAVIFLNRVRFTADDTELARLAVRMYMDLFTACLADEAAQEGPITGRKKKPRSMKLAGIEAKIRAKQVKQQRKVEELKSENSRLMGAVLIGVNRAFPFTKPSEDDSSYEQYFASLFRVAHAQSISSAFQALSLLLQVSQSNSVQSDRFYNALYSRIFDAAEGASSSQASFLSVMFKALTMDTDSGRKRAVVKRVLQASLCGSSAFSGSCLVAISESFKGRHFGFLKSFSFLSETDEDGEEETFLDADKQYSFGSGIANNLDLVLTDSDSEGNVEKRSKKEKKSTKEEQLTSDTNTEKIPSGPPSRILSPGYDPGKRDPRYARADRSALWEAVPLCAHYHPSVSLFAQTICKDGKQLQYPGDPLKDFSEIAFLDRFSYRTPKNRLAKSLYGQRSARYRDDPVANTDSFQELAKSGKIGKDDAFLARFFEKNPGRVRKESELHGSGGKDSDVDSDEGAFEEAMMEEMRRLGADGDTIGVGPDIDEEHPDELLAFEEAFTHAMANDEVADNSDEEERDADDDTVVALPAHENSDEVVLGGDELSEDSQDGAHPKRKRPRDETQSVFAAAEDYEQAIDMDLANTAVEVAPGARPHNSNAGHAKKRRKRQHRVA